MSDTDDAVQERERQTFLERLAVHAAAHQVVIPELVGQAWATHFGLLRRWNRTHNLTRIVDPDDAILKHYLDCALPLLPSGPLPEALLEAGAEPARAIDVGSGAGFPGLVAGMLWAGTDWQGTPWAGLAREAGGSPELVLVEPARKRQSFLQVAAKATGVGCRVVSPPGPGTLQGALVFTRATFSGGLRQSLWPYVAPRGLLVAWTTPHELSMWRDEARTWPGASSTSCGCVIGGVDRRFAVIRRAG